MAGARDPLEDMLYSEVDEKAVSDLVGSLESQLVGQNSLTASQSEVRRAGASGTVNHHLGKLLPAQLGTTQEQRQTGLHKVEQIQEVSSKDFNERISISNSVSSSLNVSNNTGSSVIATNRLQSHAISNNIVPNPTPGVVTLPSPICSSDAAVVAQTNTVPNNNHITSTIRTVSSRIQSVNGNSGTVTLNSPVVASAPGSVVGLQAEVSRTVADSSVNSVVIGSGAGNGSSNMSVSESANTVGVVAQSNHVLSQPVISTESHATSAIALNRPPNPAVPNTVHNASDSQGSALPVQGVRTVPPSVSGGPLTNTETSVVKSDSPNHIKTIVPNHHSNNSANLQPITPAPVVTPTVTVQSGSVVAQVPVASTPASVTTLAKPTTNVVGQTTTLLRPCAPSTGVATATPPQRPGVVTTPRAVAPQLIVRPQQQTTIQLPPGFTIPPGMVLVRTEAGQLVMVPQQVLAQVQAQNQAKNNLSPRPATPTAGPTFRVTAPAVQSPGTPQAVRSASPAQAKVVQTLNPSSPALQKTSVMTVTPPQKPMSVITAGQSTPSTKTSASTPKPAVTLQTSKTTPATSATPTSGAPVLSQEMQENVKKCKNFLATLIKLASHNSPSPETSRNVKALVQDLLDAKIEPEEFTNRLQSELKSSPQPYLVPFLKKSLPALRLTLLNSQQSLTQLSSPPTPAVTVVKACPPSTLATVVPAVRPAIVSAAAHGQTATLALKRPGTQVNQTRMPVVITQTMRPQVGRGPTIQVRGPVDVTVQASANQKQKLNDPGGGTFRDDDDINDVASMAGVNLNEENARILATGSELVGTQIRSCKDEAFLPTALLHKRMVETARRFGVTEVSVEAVSLVSHATQARLRNLLEMVSAISQHRADSFKDEQHYEQSSDVRAQLKFFEQLERLEKQRKDDEEREILLKAAKSRSRQEDPEQARLKQKAKEMQQQELAQMRQRDANLTALAAIGPRKKRKLDNLEASGTEADGDGPGGSAPSSSSSSALSSRQLSRQRITRVNLRDFIFCMEQERTMAKSMLLYKALLK
ncbi:transcription initiation factor TFIID subunit 4 [Chanos chanos]|uniref:Transcription initiation factor TFIID subunit 4 n=1 Tax=Chanos chanos TaxID=29144 RepID=A0A6J2WQ42_CHACN|nr:transcription initiation factor TFIID subunit 4-like [Chanos chanos]